MIILLLVTVFIYRPALKGGFVFDDFGEVSDLAEIKLGFMDAALKRPFRALTAASYRLDYLIPGRISANYYHGVNLFFHLLAGMALAMFWRKAALWAGAGKDSASWAGIATGAVFLLHPLNVEAVSYVSARGNLLGAVFIFSGLWFVFKAFEEKLRLVWYIASLICICAALFCNEAAVAGPVLAIALQLLLAIHREGAATARVGSGKKTDKKSTPRTTSDGAVAGVFKRYYKFLIFSVPYCLILLAWISSRLFHRLDWGAAISSGDVQRNWATPLWAMGTYVRLALWPVGMSIDHRLGPTGMADAFFHILLGVAAGICGLFSVYYGLKSLTRMGAISSYAAFWWVLSLSAVVVAPIADPVAERRAYMAMGAIGLMPMAAMRIFEQRGKAAKALISSGLIALFLWTISAAIYISGWENPRLLWENAVKWRPSSARAWDWLGSALLDSGDTRGAIMAYEMAIECAPSLSRPEGDLGVALTMEGKYEEAARHFENAIGKDPSDWRAYLDYGALETDRGNYLAAEKLLERALQLQPGYAVIWFDMGNALRGGGKLDRAKAAYIEALRLNPDHLGSRVNLAETFEDMNDFNAALQEVNKALARNPNYEPALMTVSRLAYRMGDLEKSVYYLQRYLQIRGDDQEAWTDLGKLYKKMGREAEAQKAFEMAQRLNPPAGTNSPPDGAAPSP